MRIFASTLLIAAASARAEAQPALPGPLEAGWKGQRVCEKLQEDADVRILRCTFPPGLGHERHYHVPNYGYTLQGGRMRITDSSGTVERDLVAGRLTPSPGTAWHEVLNVGRTTVVYLLYEPKRAAEKKED